jgi:HAD superfamily hydrolase (TIGR01509 family)
MKYWVFDLDGTLVDSFKPYFDIVEEFLGQKITREQKKEFIGLHPAEVFGSRLSAETAKAALDALKERSERDAGLTPAFESIHNVVQHLTKNGRRVAVWTSRDFTSAKMVLEKTGLGAHIDHLVSGDCVNQRKPHPEGILKLQSLFGCEITDMVMVGDHDMDIEGGKAAGAYTVRASWHNHWDDGVCNKAHTQFFCHKEFSKWVEGKVQDV